MMEKQKGSIAQYFIIIVSIKLFLKKLFGSPRHQTQYRLDGMHLWKEYALMVCSKTLKQNKPGGRLAIYMSVKEVLEYVDTNDIIWFKNGERVKNV